MQQKIKEVAGKNFAMSVCLVLYVLLIGGAWAWVTIDIGVPMTIPDNVLYIGIVIASLQSGVNITDKFIKHS